MSSALKYLPYPLLVVFLLSGCLATTPKERKDLCLDIQPEKRRLECYWSDIRAMITSQIESDYRAYLRELQESLDRGEYERIADTNELRNVRLDVFLSPSGVVERINFLDTSRNARFDTLVERSLRNAGPFYLPADENIYKALRRFRYSVQF